MNKLHLGGAILTILVVGIVVVAVGTGGWNMIGTDTAGGSAGPHSDDSNSMADNSDDSDSMTVENVSVRDRTAEGVVYLDLAVAGDLDTERLGRSLERMYDDPTVNVSTMELVEVQGNAATAAEANDARAGTTHVVTIAVATDDRSSTAHVVRRIEHYLENTNWEERPSQSAMQTDDSAARFTVDSSGRVCKVTDVFYQIDFVVGEPIEQLQGPEGTYTPDELIRFAHGSTGEPVMRLSDGEFITHPELSERIESQSIEVENGMATVTFSVAEGAGPVELSLVSYTKPGPGWSRATEHLQVLVDADTETFASGGPYTLRVTLPEAEAKPCKTAEATTTATPTVTQTDTPTPETPVPTSEPAKSVAETPTPAKRMVLDLRVGGDGQSFPLEFAPVQNGERYGTAVGIENTGNVPGRYLCAVVTDVDGSENGLKEPEGDAGVSDRPGSELLQYLDIEMTVKNPNGGPANTVYAGALTSSETQCVRLQEPLTDDGATLRVEVIVAEEDITNAMSDTATFDVELTLYAHDPNEE